jgi:hypothetical protein
LHTNAPLVISVKSAAGGEPNLTQELTADFSLRYNSWRSSNQILTDESEGMHRHPR